jgi:hypothetical protein
MNIEQFNADWLKAWSEKDVERLVGFYTEDCDYKDPQVPAGLKGREALRAYLTGLFAATPPIRYNPDETWAIDGGFCGRWFADIGETGEMGRMRGFDLVLLRGDEIALNEVFVHNLPAA